MLEGKSDNEKPGQHAEEDAPDPVIKRVDGSGKREVHTGLTLEARESKAGSTGKLQSSPQLSKSQLELCGC